MYSIEFIMGVFSPGDTARHPGDSGGESGLADPTCPGQGDQPRVGCAEQLDDRSDVVPAAHQGSELPGEAAQPARSTPVRTDPAEPMALLAAALLVDLAASDATVISRLAAMRGDTRR